MTAPSSVADTIAPQAEGPRLRLAPRSRRVQFVLSRLVCSIPVVVSASLLTFFVLNVLPGSAAEQLLGVEATPEQVARLEAEFGLDRPAWRRYVEWAGGVLTGDLGQSLANRQPAAALLLERLPVTGELVALAVAVSLGLAIPTALLAARKPGGIFDRSSSIVCVTTLSVPSYALALLLVSVFAVSLNWFPSIGFSPLSAGVLRNLQSIALPVTALALPLFGIYVRFLRGDLIEQMSREGYVLTAAAKGVGRTGILIRHVLRNSLFGLLTIVGVNVGALVGGTVIIEQIFALPGIGRLLMQAVLARDAVVAQAVVLSFAVITVVANMTVDSLYVILDPRLGDGRG